MNGSVVVRVIAADNVPCDSDPDIVRRLIDEILASDLSGLGLL